MRPRILAIVGPTGTGKSALAVAVARELDAEILSADSVQVYRGLDIGSAKAGPELRAQIPHHGLDLVDPDDPMSAGRYARYARQVAERVHAAGRRLVLCGGTGLYARAFAGGLVPDVGSDPELRAELEALDTDGLRARLARVDPAAARRVHPRNRVRLVRAVELAELGGRAGTQQHAEHGFSDRPFDVTWVGLRLDRDALWARLRARSEAMFAAGLVDEVAGLRAAGFGAARPLRSIGYLEAGRVLDGSLDRASAIERTWIATRRYAKRQMTWFRSEPGLRWCDAVDPESARAALLSEA